MSLTPQEIQQAFEIVQAIRDETDKEQSKPQNMSNEGITFAGPVGRMAEIEQAGPTFNKAANDIDKQDALGKGSEMVEKDKSSLENKPSPDNPERKDVDRAAHQDSMAKEDLEAQKAEILRMAEQIQEQQGPELGMGR